MNEQTVPTIISTKDMAYLEDMFHWNFSLAKEANHFSMEANDEALKQEFQSLYQMHQKICQNIISILKEGSIQNEQQQS